jgi:Uma2 family endonuclease
MVAASQFAPSRGAPMTPDEFIAWESKQDSKYEYIFGNIHAMTGGSIPHNDIAVNLGTDLKNLLRGYGRGSGCKVLIADAKLQTSSSAYFYPDVMVTCDERDRTAIDAIRYPCLVVEVSSPSTGFRDRSTKLHHYRHIETLQEYVLIDSERMFVEIYRRYDQNKWEYIVYLAEEITEGIDKSLNEIASEIEITLTSINYSFSLAVLYENVILSK